jgi:hypothetical protein
MVDERTPEDKAAGILRIGMGGTVKAVPTLKAGHIEEWGRLLASEDPNAKVPSEWTVADVGSLAGESATRLIDLCVAYDRTGALGGREWLGENADPAQLYAAVVAMVGNAFPLAESPEALTGLMLLRAVVRLGPPSGTNGASTNGASTRKRSGRASTRNSS